MGTRKRRTSCGQPHATAIFPAQSRAASSSSTVTTARPAEVFLGLDVRTVGEQWRPARRIDAEHRGMVVQPVGVDEDPCIPHL